MDKQISIMPCLDMQNGRVVKGVHFVDIRDAGDPVECAQAYCKAGADKISVSSAAFRKPDIIPEMIAEFSPEKVGILTILLQCSALQCSASAEPANQTNA